MVFQILPSGVEWYFKIVARNGRTLAHSEGYRNKTDARHAAQTIIDQAGSGTIEE